MMTGSPLQFEAAHARHAYIEQEASRRTRSDGVEKLPGRSVGLDPETDGHDQPAKEMTDGLVVIDDENDWFTRHPDGFLRQRVA